MAWCCDACMAEGVTLTSKVGGEEFHLCRRCYGKLILSIPKNATSEQVKAKLAEMTGSAPPPSSRPKHTQNNVPRINIGIRNGFKPRKEGRGGRFN